MTGYINARTHEKKIVGLQLLYCDEITEKMQKTLWPLKVFVANYVLLLQYLPLLQSFLIIRVYCAGNIGNYIY